MSIPSLQTVSSVVHPEPLTPAGFATFGTVIATPLSSNLTSYPQQIPDSLYPAHQPRVVPANQGTALKASPVSPLINNYGSSRSSLAEAQAESVGLMSIFSSFPRRNTYVFNDTAAGKLSLRVKLGILERHPYTTQTFCPFNYSVHNNARRGAQENSVDGRTYMLVIVAPTLSSSANGVVHQPDLANVKAFFAVLNDRHSPTMAVTYSPGTWHAPMIVIGSQRVDFLVTQFGNGIPNDDCQEVLIGSGPDTSTLDSDELKSRRENGLSSPGIEVALSFLDPEVQMVRRSSRL